MKFPRPLLWAAVVGLAAASLARADEPLFGYIYTTDLLPQGQSELEQWLTFREGRSEGEFHLLQARTEYSRGISDRFQLSGYLNLAQTRVDGNTPSGETSPPEVFADYEVNPDSSFSKSRLESVAVEGIYRFFSPYTDPVGFAVYLEPSVGPRTLELETRAILQKNFDDDKVVFAANLTIGQEKRYLHGDASADPGSVDATAHWDKETDVNFGLAGSYRFASNWYAGGELQNEREWAGFNPLQSENRTNVAWYLGPTLHYGGKGYFLTATYLKQLHGARDYADDAADSFVVHGISNADDFENYRVRLKAGLYL